MAAVVGLDECSDCVSFIAELNLAGGAASAAFEVKGARTGAGADCSQLEVGGAGIPRGFDVAGLID